MADEGGEPTQTNTDESPEAVENQEPEPTIEQAEATKSPEPAKPVVVGPKRGWRDFIKNKKRSIPAAIALVLLVILSIPATRYGVLGLFIRKNLSVVVTDSTTGKPISSASVTFAGKGASTDAEGKATFKVKVGSSNLQVKKNYYTDYSAQTLMPLSGKSEPVQVKLQATGRQVPITVNDKISEQPLADAIVTAANTEIRTGKDGKAIMVLPADQTTVDAVIIANGYNQAKTKITITDKESPDNILTATPVGKVYFLSKLSGKIDVVKTNLDGSDRKTVLKGTGKEQDTGTVLLASRDWKYLALKSRRDSKLPKLYLIQTSTDTLTTMDEGDADFSLVGWHNDSFVYQVSRNAVKTWQPKQSSIKSFNASKQQITTLDSTGASGSNENNAKYERYYNTNIYLLGDKIVFTKTWQSGAYSPSLAGLKNTLVSVSTDGTNRKTITSINATNSYFGQIVQPEAYKLYVQIYTSSADTYYSLDSSGNYKKDSAISLDDFNKSYPTYLLSPSGQSTFWSEDRDGKNTLFIGNNQGQKGKQIATLSEFETYGWYTDKYLLVSKDSSELYATSPKSAAKPIKISDYHKPEQNFYGYGGGYGGI